MKAARLLRRKCLRNFEPRKVFAFGTNFAIATTFATFAIATTFAIGSLSQLESPAIRIAFAIGTTGPLAKALQLVFVIASPTGPWSGYRGSCRGNALDPLFSFSASLQRDQCPSLITPAAPLRNRGSPLKKKTTVDRQLQPIGAEDLTDKAYPDDKAYWFSRAY